jgi:site-specific recombinase XerD
VEEVLKKYMEERKRIDAVAGNENALFLSMQKKRINIRTVEKLVKKYSKLITQFKNITPQKLRSTYGTNLYRETGDICLVADVLGHRDVQTTKMLYTSLEEERRKKAVNYVKLRKNLK